jgi:putative transposase
LVIKKVEDVQLNTDEKRCYIQKEHLQLSIKKQCKLIHLNRASYDYKSKKPLENKDLNLMNRIDELYTKHPFYGSCQMRNALRLEGYKVKYLRQSRRLEFVNRSKRTNLLTT